MEARHNVVLTTPERKVSMAILAHKCKETEHPITLFEVVFSNEEGTWSEPFTSIAELETSLRVLRAAMSMAGYHIDLPSSLNPSFVETQLLLGSPAQIWPELTNEERLERAQTAAER